LILTDCEIEAAPDVRSVLPGRTVQEYPLAYFSAKDIRSGSPAQVPLRQIPVQIVEQERRIRELEQSLAAESALALVTGNFEDLGEAAWKQRRKIIADARSRLFRLRTEPWRRSATGFGCFCFVLVGAPLAILLKKADVVSRFGLAFGGILVAYYPLFMGCCDLAKSGTLPPYIVWLPNAILAVIGVWLLKRVIRY
jgi:lipopolysaccharide export system permease protein